ncbi:YaaA family protein [Cryptosporangium phraense]|uniref:Peroxide stress protein YaaA n=1 Tax=Cryptosporangium phraense TaxID=2593070 RepID=A0A545AJS9_9ACTN|nr:peroxide stress protein YaaA [Cryptosporangium phraense]TQS41576.1 peroxide stress protein YaaA [Cryptosporangium phraense]
MPNAVREKAPLTLLLPPSETKRPGGDGPALEPDTLAFPELLPVRQKLLAAVRDLSGGSPEVALRALGLSAGQRDQLELNASLDSSPTSPALFRYTGVLYDAFDPSALTPAMRKRAASRVVIASALFGAVRGSDPIPAYRLSADARLPGLGTLAALWKPVLGPVLASLPGLVVDLRSGAYAQLAPVPDAVTVRVLYVAPDGSRSVVSHFNKHAKGLLARALATTGANVTTPAQVVRVAAKAGLIAERNGPRGVDVLLYEPPAGTPAAARAART